MKKLLVYPILLILLFNSMGYYIIFEVNRHQIRKEMQSAFTQKVQITVIEVPDAEAAGKIRWVHTREFIHQGKLYDIIYSSPRNGKTLYYCRHDPKEERLVKEFQRVNTSKTTQAMWNLMAQIALPVPVLQLQTQEPMPLIYPVLLNNLTSVILPTDTPPPRILS